MGFVKINSSSPVGLSLRVLCCPILLATGFVKSVFRVLKKNLLILETNICGNFQLFVFICDIIVIVLISNEIL
jgi:hypothetical protein